MSWRFDQAGIGPVAPPVSFRGRELEVGISANVLIHLALHYVLFDPDTASVEVACRSTRGCGPSIPSIGHVGILLEASFAFGGS